MKGIAVVAALWLCSSLVLAQQVEQERMARTFESGGDFRSAARIYLELLRESPTSKKYYDGVVRSLSELGEYPSLLSVSEEFLRRTPDFDAALIAAMAATKSNKPAEVYFKQAEKLAGSSAERFADMGRMQASLFLFRLAATSYNKARELSGDNNDYAEQLYQMYSALGEYEKAVDEVVRIVRVTGDLSAAQGRLAALMTSEDGSAAVKKGITSLTDRDTDMQRLKVWLLQHTGQWNEAYHLVQRLDAAENRRGNLILQFAESARRSGAFDVALEAYDNLQSTIGSVALSAAFGFVQTLDQRAQRSKVLSKSDARDLIRRYQSLVQRHSDHPVSADALLRVAELERNVFNDDQTARDVLVTLINRWRGTEASGKGALLLSDIYYGMGHANQAIDVLTSVEQLNVQTSDAAALRRADILLFQGAWTEAQNIYRDLAKRTQSVASNDAISRLILLLYAKDDSVTISRFIRGMELKLLRKHADAATAFREAGSGSREPDIADRCRIEEVRCLLDNADTASALSVLERIVQSVPESTVGDQALFIMADILEATGETTSAQAVLTTILVQYPRSILVPQARERIRKLRGDA